MTWYGQTTLSKPHAKLGVAPFGSNAKALVSKTATQTPVDVLLAKILQMLGGAKRPQTRRPQKQMSPKRSP